MTFVFLMWIVATIVVLGLVNISECRTPTKDRGSRTVSKIYGGIGARKNQFPWQVAIFEDGYFGCGGSIINEMTILTAAHCIDPQKARNQQYTITAGDHDLDRKEKTQQTRTVTKAILHENYNDDTLEHDIALLLLAHPLILSEAVKHIRMADNLVDRNALRLKFNCYNTGWGEAPFGYPAKLRWVKVTLIPNARCNRMMRMFGESVYATNICTSDIRKGTCSGDSGGPLFCVDQFGKPVQMGLVSWGHFDCNLPPHVNTRVSKYLPWIMRHMQVVQCP